MSLNEDRQTQSPFDSPAAWSPATSFRMRIRASFNEIVLEGILASMYIYPCHYYHSKKLRGQLVTGSSWSYFGSSNIHDKISLLGIETFLCELKSDILFYCCKILRIPFFLGCTERINIYRFHTLRLGAPADFSLTVLRHTDSTVRAGYTRNARAS